MVKPDFGLIYKIPATDRFQSPSMVVFLDNLKVVVCKIFLYVGTQ
jgi:hypothetical protein